jgi:hypothetical protein
MITKKNKKANDWDSFVIPNGKYSLETQKKILKQLTYNEYKFIDNFMENYNLKEGVGIKNLLALALGEYKFRKKNNKRRQNAN